jgi:septal ring factor EnvC (AmiA/AmiB activator)
MRKFMISIALGATMLSVTPAMAQRYGGGFQPAREIQRDINQLENRIQRATQRGNLSRREAVSLRREANQVQRQYYRFQRNGLDRGEIQQLRAQINRIEYRLREDRRDRDRRRG